jgi:hypothetical protein
MVRVRGCADGWASRAISGPTSADLLGRGGSGDPAVGAQSNVYVIWNFSPNQDTAKEFLRDYIDHWLAAFQASQIYNLPMYAGLYEKPLFTDPAYAGKYAEPQFGILQGYRGRQLHMFGYPGEPNYAANQVLANFVIPDIVATAVRQPGPGGVQAALEFARAKLKFYYF